MSPAQNLAAEVADSTPVDEHALASLLTEYIAGPSPGPVMGTFDSQPIELTEENKAWMAETSKAAGRGLTIKGTASSTLHDVEPSSPQYLDGVCCKYSTWDPSP